MLGRLEQLGFKVYGGQVSIGLARTLAFQCCSPALYSQIYYATRIGISSSSFLKR
jgi:hypothetical protein